MERSRKERIKRKREGEGSKGLDGNGRVNGGNGRVKREREGEG